MCLLKTQELIRCQLSCHRVAAWSTYQSGNQLRCLMFVKIISLPDVSILTLNKRNWYELQKQLTLWVFACALFTLGMFFLSQKLLKHLKLSAFASRQLPACQSIGCQQLPWQLTSSCERCPRRESQGPAHIQLRSKSNPWIGLSAKIKYACHPQ